MMEQELQTYDDVDLEDGEISDSSDYTPLQRPATLTAAASSTSAASPLTTCHQMQTALDEEEEEEEEDSSDSSSSSSAGLKKLAAGASGGESKSKRKQRVRRTVMVRVQPPTAAALGDAVDAETQQKRARFKKYNIWTAALQEDALTENMRGCGVTRDGGANDRSVENYDFSLKYRLNGENCLKRRLSNSADDLSDGSELHAVTKRGRPSSVAMDSGEGIDGGGGGGVQRRSVKSRLGHRSNSHSRRRGSSPNNSGGSEDTSYEPRHILDLEEGTGRAPLEVAREIANKLYEEKDELLVRIVEVIGTELPMEIYKETQRIEADGGMMIKNGRRRRTPGGVFLFLLKHNDRLTAADQKSIFLVERQNDNKWRKKSKSKSRDRKVEELKKRLSEQETKRKEPAPLSKVHLLLGNDLSLENQAANLSNPPPSPVGHEHSPEYKTHAINHVPNAEEAAASASAEKASTSSSAALAVTSNIVAAAQQRRRPTAASAFDNIADDTEDFLDLNYGDMDFF